MICLLIIADNLTVLMIQALLIEMCFYLTHFNINGRGGGRQRQYIVGNLIFILNIAKHARG